MSPRRCFPVHRSWKTGPGVRLAGGVYRLSGFECVVFVHWRSVHLYSRLILSDCGNGPSACVARPCRRTFCPRNVLSAVLQHVGERKNEVKCLLRHAPVLLATKQWAKMSSAVLLSLPGPSVSRTVTIARSRLLHCISINYALFHEGICPEYLVTA